MAAKLEKKSKRKSSKKHMLVEKKKAMEEAARVAAEAAKLAAAEAAAAARAAEEELDDDTSNYSSEVDANTPSILGKDEDVSKDLAKKKKRENNDKGIKNSDMKERNIMGHEEGNSVDDSSSSDSNSSDSNSKDSSSSDSSSSDSNSRDSNSSDSNSSDSNSSDSNSSDSNSSDSNSSDSNSSDSNSSDSNANSSVVSGGQVTFENRASEKKVVKESEVNNKNIDISDVDMRACEDSYKRDVSKKNMKLKSMNKKHKGRNKEALKNSISSDFCEDEINDKNRKCKLGRNNCDENMEEVSCGSDSSASFVSNSSSKKRSSDINTSKVEKDDYQLKNTGISKKRQINPEKEENNKICKKLAVEDDPSNFKMYIRGLPWRATEDEVRQYFSTCGEIGSIEMPIMDDGRSSGTAIINFMTKQACESCLELNGSDFNGRWLNIKYSSQKPIWSPREPSQKANGCTTVFVGNLSFQIDEATLLEAFGKCGEITQVRFAEDRETGQFKGFGHIEFVSTESTDLAVKMAGTDIMGRPVRVDFANPRKNTFGGGRGKALGKRGTRSHDGGRVRSTMRGGGSITSKKKGGIMQFSGNKTTFD